MRIDASPATVFEFFTDPALMARWKGANVTLDPRPGGIYRAQISDQAIVVGEYVELDPPNRLVFTWGWEGGFAGTPPGSSMVEVMLERDGDGTLVRLVHTNLPSAEAAELHGQGWDQYLPRLVIAAAGGEADADPNTPKEES